MITLSNTYKEKWVFKDHPEYIITECKKVINTHRGTIVKKTLKGCTVGWWIASKFVPQSKVNDNIQLIIKTEIPF